MELKKGNAFYAFPLFGVKWLVFSSWTRQPTDHGSLATDHYFTISLRTAVWVLPVTRTK